MLSDKIKQVLARHYQFMYNREFSFNEDGDYEEILFECGKELDILDRDEHRWWDTFTIIKEFRTGENEVYIIGYGFASANRDESIFELGWDFDRDTVCFYEEKEKVTVVKCYNEISEDEIAV